jgi:hypothetical protein
MFFFPILAWYMTGQQMYTTWLDSMTWEVSAE